MKTPFHTNRGPLGAPRDTSAGDLVPANTGVSPGGHNAQTGLLSVEILLSQVSIVDGVAHDDQRIALGDELDRTLIGSNDSQHVIRHNEVSGVDLVPLRNSDNRIPIELAVDLYLSIKDSHN